MVKSGNTHATIPAPAVPGPDAQKTVKFARRGCITRASVEDRANQTFILL